MRVLGIETSCDETAAAVVDDLEVLSNVVSSQLIHEKYGGIVPEFASREQIKALSPIVSAAMESAGITLEEIEGLAVTCGPGLSGSLLAGLSYAKGLTVATGKPMVAVNHLEGHLFAHRLAYPEEKPPLVCLLVSGGHTQLVHVEDWGRYKILGSTLDDAAGEAFDKVGKMLDIPFPAGARIDRLSADGDPEFIRFPRAMLGKGLDFSFSGLKTSVLYHIRKKGEKYVKEHLRDICASFQRAVVDVLVEKTFRAVSEMKLHRIAVGGGVSANSELRRTFEARGALEGIRVGFPELELTTDNAAMIAAAGSFHLERGMVSPLDVGVYPGLGLEDMIPTISLGEYHG